MCANEGSCKVCVSVRVYGSVIVQTSAYTSTLCVCVCLRMRDRVAISLGEKSNVMYTVYYCDTSLPHCSVLYNQGFSEIFLALLVPTQESHLGLHCAVFWFM